MSAGGLTKEWIISHEELQRQSGQRLTCFVGPTKNRFCGRSSPGYRGKPGSSWCAGTPTTIRPPVTSTASMISGGLSLQTVNAPRMKGEALQRLMRHKSYTTTLGYINLASQIDDAVTEDATASGTPKATGRNAG